MQFVGFALRRILLSSAPIYLVYERMLLNKEEILAQKHRPQVRKTRLHWPLVVAALPFFGVVAAFGIAPDTVPEPIELQHVIEDIALPSGPSNDTDELARFWRA